MAAFENKEIKKVLIIDDVQAHLKLIKMLLSYLKHTDIITAKNALDGYALLKASNEIDIIILDFDMPYLNGKTFEEFLRKEKNYEIPIIFTSADFIETNPENKTYYIAKPFQKENLEKVIDEVLNLN